MEPEIIILDNDYLESLYERLDSFLTQLEELVNSYGIYLNGELYMSEKDLMKFLKVSRKTLYTYRTEGLIPYIQLPGKILYKESDVQKILDGNYIKTFGLDDFNAQK